MHACGARVHINMDTCLKVIVGFRRTWLNHQSLSAIGKVHSCIRRTLHGQGSSVQNAGTSREGDEECVLCTCHICKGRKWRSGATVAKHLRS